ncbi:MAG: type IV toxin-antitoxin system AbiEi family antitoxin [Terriglobia bacterium]|jgi:predicted transcriptional regulator of viral defense system
MEPAGRPPKARHYVENLAATGRYHFGSNQAQAALGISAAAAKVALNRLAKQGAIASPARGFYVIVPPEYRSLGCLPADQFIPALMKSLDLPYYAGLLTAAQYYGAAHQRPQEFQVFLEKRRLPIACGKVRVAFMIRKRLPEVPVQSLNTPRGTLLVSTPEATAVDLVGYQHRAGGIDQVATVLSELADRIDPEKLAAAAATAAVPWAQRLGYLLERVGAGEKVAPLKEYVRARAHESAPLLPNAPKPSGARRQKALRNEDWKLYINAEVELDL